MPSETVVPVAIEVRTPPIGVMRWIIVLALFLLTAPLVRMADSMKVPDQYSRSVGLRELPLVVGEWTGKDDDLDALSLDLLKPDDYVLRTYQDPVGIPLNFLVVYGHLKQSFHSPGFCLPGGGWQIMQKSEEPVTAGGLPIEMNRFLIQRVIDGHDIKQVVIYCFVQGDNATSSLMRHNWNLLMAHFQQKRRTGALMRVIIPVVSTEDVAVARAKDFITRIYPELKKRIG